MRFYPDTPKAAQGPSNPRRRCCCRAECTSLYFAGRARAHGERRAGRSCRRAGEGHARAHTRQAITRPQYTRLYTRPIYRPYSIDTHRTQPQQHPAPGPPGTPARRAFSFCPLTREAMHAYTRLLLRALNARPSGQPAAPMGEKVLCAFLSVCGFRSPKIFLGFKNFFGVPPPVTPKRRGGAKNLFTNCLHEK